MKELELIRGVKQMRGHFLFFSLLSFFFSFHHLCATSMVLPGGVLEDIGEEFSPITPPSSSYPLLPAALSSQNFRWLIEGIIGGMAQPIHSETTVKTLHESGIAAIVSLNGDRWHSAEEISWLEKYQIQTLTFNLPDPLLCTEESMKNLEEIIKIITQLSATLYPLKKGIVIHCQWGNMRTGAILGGWLLAHSPEISNNFLVPAPRLRRRIQTAIKGIGKTANLILIKSLLNNTSFLTAIMTSRNKEICDQVEPLFPLEALARSSYYSSGAPSPHAALLREGAAGGALVITDMADEPVTTAPVTLPETVPPIAQRNYLTLQPSSPPPPQTRVTAIPATPTAVVITTESPPEPRASHATAPHTEQTEEYSSRNCCCIQ